MSDSRGTVFFLGAALTGWMTCDMVSEAPEQTFAFIKYFFLGVAVITTIYSGVKWMTMK
jgi:hypothetical protein